MSQADEIVAILFLSKSKLSIISLAEYFEIANNPSNSEIQQLLMQQQSIQDQLNKYQTNISSKQAYTMSNITHNDPKTTSLEQQFNAPEINKIQSFIIPPKMGINYKPGIWHFPLISTEDTNFLVIDRKGSGENLTIFKFKKESILLEYEKKIS